MKFAITKYLIKTHPHFILCQKFKLIKLIKNKNLINNNNNKEEKLTSRLANGGI